MKKKNYKYPLLENAFSDRDILCGINVLKSKKITMQKKTFDFENYFQKRFNVPYALMVNSGSSANLLAVATACNPMRKNFLKEGDEVLIPSICWSTSLWPIIQYKLKPIFVDVDISTLNLSLPDLKKKITKKTRAIMCVHILGLSTDMNEIIQLSKRHNLMIFEDTCESLGTTFKKKKLGTIGNFGTYSFYYSHQITSGEGGMVVCKNNDDYNILKSLRSHGWSRDTKFHNYYKNKYLNLNEKFLFINSGYNLRPTDVAAAIAHNQLKRLKKFMNIRNSNREKIINCLKKHKDWNNQFTFLYPSKNIKPSWFGLPIMLNEELKAKKFLFLKYLENSGIETRPIVSGNFLNQPCVKLYNISANNKDFKNSQKIEELGFFIGLHTKMIKKNLLNFLASKIMKINYL